MASRPRAATDPKQPRQQQPQPSHEPYHDPSASTSSFTSNSTASPRREVFRQLTREILSSPLLQVSQDLENTAMALEPTKFDPMHSMEVPLVYDRQEITTNSRKKLVPRPLTYTPSHSSYSSTNDSGPSTGRQTAWPASATEMTATPPSNSPQKAFSYPIDNTQYARRIPISRSEGNNVNAFDIASQHQYQQEGAYPVIYDHENDMNSRIQPYSWHEDERCRSPERGRGRQRSHSPVRILEDLDEDGPVNFLPNSSRRARSPHKKLFGENGWLGRSTSMNELPAEKYKKPALKSFSEKIKQRVEDIAGDVKKAKPFQPKPIPQSTFPISLDPPTQAKLYSEMELMICVTANAFLLDQHKQGRLSVESVSKVTNFWSSKNRPQVVQFQFDQATQRDLILANLRTFKFHGECSYNVVSLNATLYNWKTVAKEMSVRTFCMPDSVVRKHMHDSHKILEMLGAPLLTFLAFQELQVNTLNLMKKEQEKKMKEAGSHGVPREYVPPSLAEYERRSRSMDV